MTLVADKGIYSMNSQIADFYGNVVIDDDSVRITSEIINFDRTTQISRAYGNVEVRGKFTNALLFGDTVMNYPKRQYSIVIGRPLLYQIDTIKTDKKHIDSISNEQIFKFDTLSISSDTMESATIQFVQFKVQATQKVYTL
jgi:lipopolysaccharide assembly outer membrane protein LptD (OstA)